VVGRSSAPLRLQEQQRTDCDGCPVPQNGTGRYRDNCKSKTARLKKKAGGRYKVKSKFKGAQLKSLCGNSGIFVGRGFSHDISRAESERL